MNGNSHSEHKDIIPQMTPGEITADLLQKQESVSPGFKRFAVVLAVLFTIGLIAFVVKAVSSGFSDRSQWGYYVTTFSFIFGAAQGAPVLAAATRMIDAHWSKPIHRIADAFALVGLYNLILMIPVLFMIPSARGRLTIWAVDAWRKGFPAATPYLWDVLAMVALVIAGLALVHTGSRPDLAAVRDHSQGGKRKLYSILANGWRGDKKQWFALKHRVGILSAVYFMMLVFTQIIISMDISMSLVPGWRSSIYPTFQAISALQCGVASVILVMFFLRKYGGLKNYLGLDQFWGAGKILLVMSLIWFYFWWSGFIVYWYGRDPSQIQVIKLIMFHTYYVPWIISFLLLYAIPVAVLIVNRLRKSILGPTLIAVGVIVGTFANKITTYVSAFSIKDITQTSLTTLPAPIWPDGLDIMMIVGGISGGLLVYLIAIKMVPAIPMWDMKNFMLLRRFRKYKRADVTILAREEYD